MKRRVIVTGGKSGIGQIIADRFHDAGYFVVVADIDVGEDEYISQDRRLFLHCDIGDYNKVVLLMHKVNSYLKGFDVLVNNAAITQDALIETMTIEQWHRVIQINLNGTFYCCKEAIKYLKEADSPRIINIASLSGIYVNKGQANYGVSKSGIIELTRYLAVELAKYKILVNGVVPGIIDTDMLKTIPENVLSKMKDLIPLKHFGTKEDVAQAVLSLADKNNTYMTGEMVRITGGLKL